MTIKRLQCPSCYSTNFAHDEDGNMICEACGTMYAYAREEVGCRACGVLNPAGTRYCNECGLQLGRTCTACDYDNPPGLDFCENCGTPLDIISTLVEREQQQQFGNVDRRSDRLVQGKAADMIFMAQERDRMQEEEQERMQRIREQQARARKEQTRMLTIMVVIAGVVLLGIAVVVVLVTLSGG